MTLETLVMAHRYLINVAGTPVLTKNEYDDLSAIAKSQCGVASIVHSIPSVVAETYTPQEIAAAHLLYEEHLQKNNKAVTTPQGSEDLPRKHLPHPFIQPKVKTRKIYSVGAVGNYANWMLGEMVQTMEEADLVLFTGGEDVTPNLYGKKPHPMTLCNPRRDAFEKAAFERARKLDKHMIGICRGAQFLCVMAGGILVQHQDNPSPQHLMKTSSGKCIEVTSDHHQAQYPWLLPLTDRTILGWTVGLCSRHEGETVYEEMVKGCLKEGNNQFDRTEIEIVYYPKIKALAIQSHPEWAFPPETGNQREYIDYVRTLLDMSLKDMM